MGEQNLLTKINEVLNEIEGLEKHYRKIYNNAVDIEDFEISQKTQSDSYLNIRKLKEWKSVVIDLNKSVNESNIIEIIPSIQIDDKIPLIEIDEEVTDKSEMMDEPTQESSEYESDEQIKIGEYVRSKMRELSSKGFIFSDNDIEAMKGELWTKWVLGIGGYPFIRIYNENSTIKEQTKDQRGYNRYWKEIFEFGKYKLLLSSQWFERNRESFDIWYDKLDKTKDILEQKPEDNENTTTYERSGYTSKQPISIELLDKVYPIRYWNEVLIKVCEIMVLKKPYSVARFDKEPTLNSEKRTNFSYIESEIKVNKKKLSNDLWIETNRSANDIVNTSIKILAICEFNEKDLIINYE